MQVVQTPRAALRAIARNLCSETQNTKSVGHVAVPRHFLNDLNKGDFKTEMVGNWKEGSLLFGKLWAQAMLHSEGKQASHDSVMRGEGTK